MNLPIPAQQQTASVCIPPSFDFAPVAHSNTSKSTLFHIPLLNLQHVSCPYLLSRFEHNPTPGSICRFESEIMALNASYWGILASYLLKPLGIFLPLNLKPKSINSLSASVSPSKLPLKITCFVSVSTNEENNRVVKKRKYVYLNSQSGIEKEINLDSEIYLDKKGVLWETVGKYFAMKINCETDPQKANEVSFKSSRYYVDLKNLHIPIKLPIPRFMSLGQIVVRHKSVSAQNFNLSISLSHPLLGTLFEQTSVFKEM